MSKSCCNRLPLARRRNTQSKIWNSYLPLTHHDAHKFESTKKASCLTHFLLLSYLWIPSSFSFPQLLSLTHISPELAFVTVLGSQWESVHLGRWFRNTKMGSGWCHVCNKTILCISRHLPSVVLVWDIWTSLVAFSFMFISYWHKPATLKTQCICIQMARSHRSTFPTIVHQNSDICVHTKKPPELN